MVESKEQQLYKEGEDKPAEGKENIKKQVLGGKVKI